MSDHKHFPKLIIIGIISALVLGFLVLYFLFFRIGPDGEVRPLGEFLPFGRAPQGTITADRGDIAEIIPGPSATSSMVDMAPRPVLELITDSYTSGAIILDTTSDEGIRGVRYIERATGHTYEHVVGSGSLPRRLTNTTIPRVYEALWVEGGDGVIARMLAKDNTTIRSFYGRINIGEEATSTTGMLEGVFLPENITTIAVSPDGESVFYVEDSGLDATLARSNPDGSSRRVLQKMPIKQWQAGWPSASEIVLTTKPASNILGYAFSMTTAGTMRGLASMVNGLTVLSDQISRYYLYGGQDDSGYKLAVYDRRVNEPSSLSLATIPEKCAWSELEDAVFCAVPRGGVGVGEPDDWYKGITAFNDDIWKINVESGLTERIMKLPEEAGRAIDAVELEVSGDDGMLIFRNKRDGSLWALTIPKLDDEDI